MSESVLFFCAHNDDQIVGAGGTVAKYAKEGKKVYTVIFSFGEVSHPHLKEKVIRKTRVLESKKAAKVLGETEIYYLGLKESKFDQEVIDKDIFGKMEKLVKRVKPTKIFTHSLDDPHPDHRAVYRFVTEFTEKIKYKGEIYSFNVWNFFVNIRKRGNPKLVVDITDTFDIKIQAFKEHKSQTFAIVFLMWNIYMQSIWNGFNNQVKYAEVFYKIK